MAASASGRRNGSYLRIQDLAIAEDIKISIEKALKLFLSDEDSTGELRPLISTNMCYSSRTGLTLLFTPCSCFC